MVVPGNPVAGGAVPAPRQLRHVQAVGVLQERAPADAGELPALPAVPHRGLLAEGAHQATLLRPDHPHARHRYTHRTHRTRRTHTHTHTHTHTLHAPHTHGLQLRRVACSGGGCDGGGRSRKGPVEEELPRQGRDQLVPPYIYFYIYFTYNYIKTFLLHISM